MQTDLSNFIHTIRGEMLTIYSEQDLIELCVKLRKIQT